MPAREPTCWNVCCSCFKDVMTSAEEGSKGARLEVDEERDDAGGSECDADNDEYDVDEDKGIEGETCACKWLNAEAAAVENSKGTGAESMS